VSHFTVMSRIPVLYVNLESSLVASRGVGGSVMTHARTANIIAAL
jgi:hypothetical protein